MKQKVEGEGRNKVKVFSYSEMRKATHGFSGANKIGEGGFGSVFRGRLKDGTIVAIKVLSADSRQGFREFVNELAAISDIVHENLITLVGCCAEGSHRILVYNYLENNSLACTLLGSGRSNIRFNWKARVKIAVGVARGLAYLHEEIRPPIIHRDIKASNILLDKDLTPKISDFGLARLLPPNATHVSTRVAGTMNYCAEYILVLPVSFTPLTRGYLAPEYATWTHYEQGKLEEIIDIGLGDDLDVEEACRFLKIGLLCTQDAMKVRPNMTSIIHMLTGEKSVSMDRVTKPAVIGDSDLNGNNEQRPTDPDSTTMRSFATTEPLTSSEVNTETSL
ncbi:putative serine/threonine-protein kinase [Panicum miliaceum]|uniref:non-specific serine/threonine protein kinase n=1 Tax=Panicum miliaceum TaxID=4540 RepID=A0A3L6PNB0_PANMI|nr:putative serine/threonine-protein kinase [Panicum miliaceum]